MAEERRHQLRDILYLQDRINRVFEESLRDSSVYKVPGQWVPYVDIYEDDESLTLKAELPGVQREDIVLDLRDNILTISGEKPFYHNNQNESYHMIERQYGFFKRTFSVPDTVDTSRIDAKFQEGVLVVILPKSLQTKVRKITITKD